MHLSSPPGARASDALVTHLPPTWLPNPQAPTFIHKATPPRLKELSTLIHINKYKKSNKMKKQKKNISQMKEQEKSPGDFFFWGGGRRREP